MIRVFLSLFALSVVTGLALPPGDEIRNECGGRARVVWCQDAGAAGEGRALRLMGLDTDDGRGERRILPETGCYARPLLMPDGQRIIFSKWPGQKVYAVNFDGSGLKFMADGFAVAVRHDVLAGTDWIYAGAMTNAADPFMVNLRRFRLDKPEISEPVWSRTPLHTDNIQLSADGRHASGLFPWPACGIAELPDRAWKKYGDGCWPALSPDNQLLFWIFDGAHRNLAMFRAGTEERWTVNINGAPGIDGYEVYHPRWSNHARFMVMTGPYKIGEGANRIRGGGPEVEIYIGKFAPDFRKIERWTRATFNQFADFYPDLWVASAAQGSSGPPAGQSETAAAGPVWPVTFEGMYFYWQDKAGANTFTDPATGESHVCRVEAKGRARFGRRFEMAPSGGAFLAEGGAGDLAQKCAARGQLAVEALITPMKNNVEDAAGPACPSSAREARTLPLENDSEKLHAARGAGRATASPPCRLGLNAVGETNISPIIGHAAGSGAWNFMLGQQDRGLVFQVRAADGGPDYMVPVGRLDGREPSHVIISCSTSSMACYMNGETTLTKNGIYGGNWKPGRLVFGNELRNEYPLDTDDAHAWKGLVRNAAVYARWIGPEEARKKFRALNESMVTKKPVPALAVEAELLAAPDIPAPAAIAPYRRALAVEHYKAGGSADKKFPSGEFLAARWVIMDGRVLKSASRRPGETYALWLEPFADHPELEGERQVFANDRFDLPLYYAVGD